MGVIMVAPGDIWRVGPHVFACGDLKYDAPLRLMDFVKEEPTLLYTDMPWSGTVAAQYRRMAGVTADPLTFEGLTGAVLRAAKRTKGCAFMEASRLPKSVAAIETEARLAGVELVQRWNTRWHQFDGILFRIRGEKTDGHEHPALPGADEHHAKMAGLCVHSCTQPGDLVLDTCMGFGLVAMSSVVNGRRVIGTELNPARVERCLQRVGAAINERPERIGSL